MAWHAALRPEVEEHPELWTVRGHWAKSQGELAVAARCFWEALRREPQHLGATYQLSQVLYALGRVEEARAFAGEAVKLTDLSSALNLIANVSAFRPGQLSAAAGKLSSMGRPREAWGLYNLIAPSDASAEDVATRDELARRLTALTPLLLDEFNLALRFDLSDDPLPAWGQPADSDQRRAAPWANAGRQVPREDPAVLDSTGGVAFVERAKEAGIDFAYENSDDPLTPGVRMFEFTGGGVAILDYDQDGWPDVYLTQGCQWPPQSGQRQHADALYRNLRDGRFVNVTLAARLGDERFSQGVSAGDFDQDGFPDLYVANIGENRLYRNNGDGTFTDVTSEAGVAGEGWTTSCLIADVSGDGLPDLYDVRYVEGERLHERICFRGDTPGVCPPTIFTPQMDRLWISRGDGQFTERAAELGIHVPDGNGLGIVAGDLVGDGHTSVFVANDQTANHLFVNDSAKSDGTWSFVERAMSSGVALDYQGRPQACMGVAAGDADGNGMVDLFVTNFFEESNTLYAQLSPGFFEDVTRHTGLAEPSLKMLGFGTQFLDADLDGWLDLVVANGHIADYSDPLVPYRMRPQFFRNVGAGRFIELPASSLGKYFAGAYLGRGLARLDYNRDGRDDFVVSNLEGPAALVENVTQPMGNWVTLRLIGLRGDRDAVGASVSLHTGQRMQVAQLTAGDGYQATNERKLTFGLGDAQRIESIVVRWPGGVEQSFQDVPSNREVLLLEGIAEALVRAQP